MEKKNHIPISSISYNKENSLIIENNNGILQAYSRLLLGEELLTKKEFEKLVLKKPKVIKLIKKALKRHFSQTTPNCQIKENKKEIIYNKIPTFF